MQFDNLTFDSQSRQLWSDRTELRLSPKAFELLALLIERRPDAVSKAEIRERLWPGTFVSDSSLPSLVSEIREAIGDHRRKPRLLRTLALACALAAASCTGSIHTQDGDDCATCGPGGRPLGPDGTPIGGDPNSPGLPNWPRFEPAQRLYLDFTDSGPVAKAGLRKEICDIYIQRMKQQMARLGR